MARPEAVGIGGGPEYRGVAARDGRGPLDPVAVRAKSVGIAP